jgi:endonuclease/exonuclease/phosphatase family metal-dependent hydrolase
MSHKKIGVTTCALLVSGVLAFAVVASNLGCRRANEEAAAGSTAEDAQPLQVMTFNIRYGTANDGPNNWQNRRQLVFDVLRDHRPDIVGLQEALHFQIEEIVQAVPGFAYVGVGREDGKTKGEYSAILYRAERFDVSESDTFWLSDTPEVPGSITWGNACTRICTWARFSDKKSSRNLYIYNTHLDHVSQPSRERSAVLLIRRIADRRHRDPVVLTGDFNAGEDNCAVVHLKGKGTLPDSDGVQRENPLPLIDTFRVLQPHADDVGTFNGFNGKRSGPKIDYVFAGPDVEVLAAEILRDNEDGRYPSDHFPVTAAVSLAGALTSR